MKREIVCPDCAKNLKKLFPDASPYPGEYLRFINGKSKKELICDQCATSIKIDDDCCAFSIYSDTRPHYDWEENYINQSGK